MFNRDLLSGLSILGGTVLAAVCGLFLMGQGPGPTPGPWLQNGSQVYYDQGGVTVPSTVTGGNKGPGTINASALYVNGVAVPGTGVTQTVSGGGTGQTSFLNGLPILGAGGSTALIQGTKSGNTNEFATSTGGKTPGNCAQWGTSNNLVDSGVSGCGSGGTPVSPAPGGRLTLTSNTPIMQANVIASTNMFYAPGQGGVVPAYNGSAVVPVPFNQLTNVSTDSTTNPAATASNSAYDIYFWVNGGTATITRSPPWFSLTARCSGGEPCTGATEPTDPVYISGVGFPLNRNAIINGPGALRGTYLGTVLTDGIATFTVNFGGGAAGGSPGFLGVYNFYNQVQNTAFVYDTTPSYTFGGPVAITASISGTTLTATVVSAGSGSLWVGQTITGSGVTGGTVITALLGGTGGIGTYTVNNSQTIGSESMLASGGARAWNNSAGNRVTFIKGFNDNPVVVSAQQLLVVSGVAVAQATTGWAFDITNGFSQASVCSSPGTTVYYCSPPVSSTFRFASYGGPASLSTFGAHFISGTERGDGTNNYTYDGNNSAEQYLQVGVWQ